jgi:hypothetical protein
MLPALRVLLAVVFVGSTATATAQTSACSYVLGFAVLAAFLVTLVSWSRFQESTRCELYSPDRARAVGTAVRHPARGVA